jgi:hypothetical protein
VIDGDLVILNDVKDLALSNDEQSQILRFAQNDRDGLARDEVRCGAMKRLATLALFILITQLVLAAEGPTTVPVDSSKTFIHASTHFEFPTHVATFDRVNVFRYDDAGADISVGYDDTIVGIIATVYVYPDPNIGLDAHFDQIKDQIQQVHPSFKLLKQEKWTLTQKDHEYVGHKAVYSYTDAFLGKKQPIISQAYLIKVKGNFIAYRISFPATQQKGTDELIQKFIDKLTIPDS